MLGLISTFFAAVQTKIILHNQSQLYIVKYLVSWFILFDFLCPKLAGNWSIRITKENCRPTELNNPTILDFGKTLAKILQTVSCIVYFFIIYIYAKNGKIWFENRNSEDVMFSKLFHTVKLWSLYKVWDWVMYFCFLPFSIRWYSY